MSARDLHELYHAYRRALERYNAACMNRNGTEAEGCAGLYATIRAAERALDDYWSAPDLSLPAMCRQQ